jgi:putative sigma-54 modulation protein
MNEDEAVEQMKLLGHDNFFIFFDADANRVKVLYRRRDGTYGLIEPEVG